MSITIKAKNMDGVKKKIQRIGSRQDVGKEVATIVYRNYREFVPHEFGNLEGNVSIEPFRITHNEPYAKKMYYNDFNFRKVPNANATHHWDQEAYKVKKSAIHQQIQEIIDNL